MSSSLSVSFAGGHRGKLFGVGTYFADTFSKADLYTTAEKHEQLGEDGAAEEHVRCMIIARVILGHTYRSIRAMPVQHTNNRPPLATPRHRSACRVCVVRLFRTR